MDDQSSAKELKDIKSALRVVRDTTKRVNIIAVAINNDYDKNFINQISCKRGRPIGEFVYRHADDVFFVDCCDYISIGTIPLAFYAISTDSINWNQAVPIPESVFKKYLDEAQLEKLKKFKATYKSNSTISFLEIIMDDA